MAIRKSVWCLAFGLALCLTVPTFAAETLTYVYDARGRLVQVLRSGTVNDGVQASYAYDKADNRTNVTVTGSGGGGVPDFSVNDVAATEGGNLVFTVTRTGTTSSSFSVNYATADGTAVAGSDYTANSGTLTFTSTQTSQTVSVATIDDTTAESAETVFFNLSGATGGATISDAQGVGTITDNDTPSNVPPTPVNDTGAQQKCTTAQYGVIANDTDPDGDYPLTVSAVTGIGFSVYSSSEVQFSSTQSTGAKVGTYTVQDSRGATATATLTVTVSGGVCQ